MIIIYKVQKLKPNTENALGLKCLLLKCEPIYIKIIYALGLPFLLIDKFSEH